MQLWQAAFIEDDIFTGCKSDSEIFSDDVQQSAIP